MIKIKKNILKKIYKKRPPEVRKYDYGSLLVIGGSDFYSGSPALSAMAAYNAGVDMVTIIAPKRAADIIASFSPNMIVYPLPGSYLTKEHLATLIALTESARECSNGKTAVAIGGGLGRTEETKDAILEYLSQLSVPCVVDADAIHAVSKKPGIISGKPFLATPHSYEFFMMTGKEVHKLPEDKKTKMVQEEAARLKTTILLKGRIDKISNGKDIALNSTGSPLMSKGGMGDTLTGIAGALLARGNDPFTAAQGAAYINGLAGEIAAGELGESVTATDLIEAIPEAIK